MCSRQWFTLCIPQAPGIRSSRSTVRNVRVLEGALHFSICAAVPATLQDSLMARLDRSNPVKEIAQVGAAIGREFSYGLLLAVA